MGWAELGLAKDYDMDWDGLDWDELGWTGMDLVGLGWTGMDWDELLLTELDWARDWETSIRDKGKMF